jgi:hypothetical protein
MIEKLERKTHRDGNLHPKAFNCLSILREKFEEFTYHNHHNQKHPLSIYIISIQEVMQCFNAVLDEIDQISTASFNTKGVLDYSLEKLPDLQKRLLFALQSHIDDCYSILKVIHPDNKKSQKLFAADWLKEVNRPVYTQFQGAICKYKESFTIVNKIKHNGGKLRPIVIYPREHGIIAGNVEKGIQIFPKNAGIVGYFLEGMQPNGRIGPDCEVHPPNGRTAISLNRNLRYHFANVYQVGNHLNSAIIKTVCELHNIKKLPLDGFVKDTTSQYDLESIAERISKLPPLFFEDEVSEKTPDIKFHRHNQNADLILEFFGSKYITWKEEPTIYFTTQIDPVCGKYQIPYKK